MFENDVKPQTDAPLSNAAAHLDAFQMKNKVAGAGQVINKSCPRTETLSFEQCNCTFQGGPSETQSLEQRK